MDPLRLQGLVIALLERIALSKRPCRFCQRMIYLVVTQDGKTIPYTAEAENHFLDCPHFAKKPQRAQDSQERLFDAMPSALDPIK